MSTYKERREREKLQMRANILKQARKLATTQGWQAVSIRNIGERIEYSPPLIYSYFKNKEDIMRALQEQGFEILTTSFTKVDIQQIPPKEALVKLGTRLYDFAQTHPDLYQVIFNLEGVVCPTEEKGKALKETSNYIRNALAKLNVNGDNMQELFCNWWAIVHGTISLGMSEQLPFKAKKGKKMIKNMLTRFADTI